MMKCVSYKLTPEKIADLKRKLPQPLTGNAASKLKTDFRFTPERWKYTKIRDLSAAEMMTLALDRLLDHASRQSVLDALSSDIETMSAIMLHDNCDSPCLHAAIDAVKPHHLFDEKNSCLLIPDVLMILANRSPDYLVRFGAVSRLRDSENELLEVVICSEYVDSEYRAISYLIDMFDQLTNPESFRRIASALMTPPEIKQLALNEINRNGSNLAPQIMQTAD